ncbi:hypothetical protein GH714_009297 [Hevea brasiliensis]|uniref:F-box associated domain-containing protein n=1 Tax=Hevea brasiliensis TaxID=3981 RepID=A0A6A6KB00_HEVBR|nr:hypothetical protein GH714_009297 [Hevea brasiliensis]
MVFSRQKPQILFHPPCDLSTTPTLPRHGGTLEFSLRLGNKEFKEYMRVPFIDRQREVSRPWFLQCIERGPPVVELYFLNADSWKNIPHIAPINEFGGHGIGIFVNGALHGIVVRGIRSLIMVFDVRDEVFDEIMLPECLVNVSAYDLCVKWNRVNIVTVGKRWKGCSTVLAFSNNGQVTSVNGIFSRAEIASLDLRSHRPKNFKNLVNRQIIKYCFGSSHLESLALLDKGNDAGDAGDAMELIQRKDAELMHFVLVFDVRYEVLHKVASPECLIDDNPLELSADVFRESSIAVIKKDCFISGQHVNDRVRLVRPWMKLLRLNGEKSSVLRIGEVLIELNGALSLA